MQTITHQMKISARDFHAPETRNFNLHSMSPEQEICNYLFNFLEENKRPRNNHYSSLIFLVGSDNEGCTAVARTRVKNCNDSPVFSAFYLRKGVWLFPFVNVCRRDGQAGVVKYSEMHHYRLSGGKTFWKKQRRSVKLKLQHPYIF